MSLNSPAAEGFEITSRLPEKTDAAARSSHKSFFRRLLDKIAANSARQAFARLAITNPRMAEDLRAAWERATEESKQ